MFSTKDPQEVIVVTFDFSALTATVTSPSVTASVASGKPDASPSAVLSGTPAISGAKILQTVIAGQDGTSYDLVCKVTSSDGIQKFVLSDVLPVVAA